MTQVSTRTFKSFSVTELDPGSLLLTEISESNIGIGHEQLIIYM